MTTIWSYFAFFEALVAWLFFEQPFPAAAIGGCMIWAIGIIPCLTIDAIATDIGNSKNE